MIVPGRWTRPITAGQELGPTSGTPQVAAAVGSADALRAFTPTALVFYPAAYVAHFFFGPLFEEPGWRGFALPRLQHRFGTLRGTLLLGLLWSAWHFFLYVPTWWQDGLANVLAGMAGFTLTTTAMTVIFTWLFNNTEASVLLAILLHASVDGTATYLQVLADKGVISSTAAATTTQLGLPIACVLWAVLLTAVTRGRLSYSTIEVKPSSATFTRRWPESHGLVERSSDAPPHRCLTALTTEYPGVIEPTKMANPRGHPRAATGT